jgi:ferredoxin
MARFLEVSVNSDCIGSGMCRRTFPATFGADDQRQAVVLVHPVEESGMLWEALESCPVEALSARDAVTGESLFP